MRLESRLTRNLEVKISSSLASLFVSPSIALFSFQLYSGHKTRKKEREGRTLTHWLATPHILAALATPRMKGYTFYNRRYFIFPGFIIHDFFRDSIIFDKNYDLKIRKLYLNTSRGWKTGYWIIDWQITNLWLYRIILWHTHCHLNVLRMYINFFFFIDIVSSSILFEKTG